MRSIILLSFAAALAAAQPKDISGTWVAKTQGPMGEAELVYRLKVDNGKITGSQTLPFGDAPIIDGKFTSASDFEFTVEMDMFGGMRKAEGKGKVVGDTLEITPAVPAPPSPSPGATAGGPSQGMRRRMSFGTVIARRGTPTPSYRAPAVDYKTLPKVELPALRDLPYNGLAKTPPMGWNSWNKFRTRFNDKTVREIADAMVASGMKDAGYQFINIDDGWQGTRDAKGVLQPNPNFPDMKALAGYVHSKGLKLGIYSSPGPRTCAGYEGSYGHEDIDAKTWASWGIDYLKYDWCSAARIWKDEDMQAVYQRMGEALARAGRPIVFSLCQYGRNKVQEWGPKVSGNLWRTTGDIRDQWQSMERIGFAQSDLAPFAAPGHWNDPDMLEIGNGGMTTEEYRTHFSLWAMIAAPLISGNDLRSMTPEIKSILLNKDVIAVDQDRLGKGGYRIAQNGQVEVWMKPLDQGAVAIALFNRGDNPQDVGVKWADVKLTGTRTVRDLWKHQNLDRKADGFSANVPPHGVVMIRVW
jgi:alpha-galactosidase